MSTAEVHEAQAHSTSPPMTTVFNDPHNFNVKHPLQNAWTLWFDFPNRKTNSNTWSQNLREIVTFATVEDFWGMHNNITRASDLPFGSNYHLFKEGIKPMWEDPANERGGKWVVQLPRKQDEANKCWLYSMLALIGESFNNEDDICGLVFSCRRNVYRISLWTRLADNQDIVMEIGRQLRANSGIPSQLKLEFSQHETAHFQEKISYEA
ncbi:eukaryotic translation initiation factor 4E [Dispira simplex]|nr:eukaryotic translation initiation factor 4E [Dispira simplex]KAJ1650485.1 eukaryotic translation initiation factor 4E [Dispira simplex]